MTEPDEKQPPLNYQKPSETVGLNYRALRDDRLARHKLPPSKGFVYGCGIPLGFLYCLFVFVVATALPSYDGNTLLLAHAFLGISALVACGLPAFRGLGIGIILTYGVGLLLFGLCYLVVRF
jgi:hypothetical protein